MSEETTMRPRRANTEPTHLEVKGFTLDGDNLYNKAKARVARHGPKYFELEVSGRWTEEEFNILIDHMQGLANNVGGE